MGYEYAAAGGATGERWREVGVIANALRGAEAHAARPRMEDWQRCDTRASGRKARAGICGNMRGSAVEAAQKNTH